MSAATTWNDIKTRTKQAFDDQPVLFIGVTAAALTSVAKIMQANTDRKRQKDWHREVKRREKADHLK